jgi:hypothetical protein
MRKFVTLAALFVCACGEPSQVSENGSADETFNQRVERQTKYIPALKRNQLPAPDGEAVSVAMHAIEANRMETTPKCKVTGAERFDSDGSIIAQCADGRDFRVVRIEGIVEAISIDCKAARDLVVSDPCDRQLVRSGQDNSIEKALSSIAKIR